MESQSSDDIFSGMSQKSPWKEIIERGARRETENLEILKSHPDWIECGSCRSVFDPSTAQTFRKAPHCPKCFESEVERQNKQDFEDNTAYWEKKVPPLYRDTDPKLLRPDKLSEVMSWEFNPTGLLLHGPTRTGKTRCMFHLIKRLIFERRRGIRIFLANQFAFQCANAFNDDAEVWAQQIYEAHIVFFDDLAKSKFTERVESELFAVIEMRAAYKLPTLITTNTVGETLLNKFDKDRGQPLVERLREFCQAIAF